MVRKVYSILPLPIITHNTTKHYGISPGFPSLPLPPSSSFLVWQRQRMLEQDREANLWQKFNSACNWRNYCAISITFNWVFNFLHTLFVCRTLSYLIFVACLPLATPFDRIEWSIKKEYELKTFSTPWSVFWRFPWPLLRRRSSPWPKKSWVLPQLSSSGWLGLYRQLYSRISP